MHGRHQGEPKEFALICRLLLSQRSCSRAASRVASSAHLERLEAGELVGERGRVAVRTRVVPVARLTRGRGTREEAGRAPAGVAELCYLKSLLLLHH